jgi:hypothetical protein
MPAAPCCLPAGGPEAKSLTFRIIMGVVMGREVGAGNAEDMARLHSLWRDYVAGIRCLPVK